MLQITDKLAELIRAQVPAPGTGVDQNPLLVFLQDLVAKINAMDAELNP
jgi:uncharacterized protein YggT (Ycf19 family)